MHRNARLCLSTQWNGTSASRFVSIGPWVTHETHPLSASFTSAANNQLLASLPPEAFELLRPRIEAVNLGTGTMLYEAGTVLRDVHFPVDSTVSLLSPLMDGACAEVAVVGQEGVVGVCAFMGGGKALSSAMVQRPGLAWRMSAGDIADLARDCEPVMQQLLRYTQALFAQMAQSSACYRHHELAPQLCRWLLQHLDRQVGDDMEITHERIAGLMGVRREGVTVAALKLQEAGLIRYRRGHITVLDRSGLEEQSCECYGVVQQAYDKLRGGSTPWPRPAGHGHRHEHGHGGTSSARSHGPEHRSMRWALVAT